MAELVTGEAVTLDLRVARLPSRGIALLLDVIFQYTLLYFTAMLAAMTIAIDEAWGVGFGILGTVVVLIGYPTAFETLSRGRTLGKMALGLRVVSDDGGPIRFRQALVRALSAVLEIWFLFGFPALFTSLINRQGKRLGDLFAGTIVIQERLPASALMGPVAVMPPQLTGWARSLELSQVPDGLALTARQYLLRFWELLPEVRDAMGQRLVDQVAARVSPPPPPGVRPEILLSAVLAERRRREEWRLAQRRARRGAFAWRGVPPHGPGPAPAMAFSGPAPGAHPMAGPPQPPPFSAPGPGQPRFLPPPQYGRGPYEQVLAPRQWPQQPPPPQPQQPRHQWPQQPQQPPPPQPPQPQWPQQPPPR